MLYILDVNGAQCSNEIAKSILSPCISLNNKGAETYKTYGYMELNYVIKHKVEDPITSFWLLAR